MSRFKNQKNQLMAGDTCFDSPSFQVVRRVAVEDRMETGAGGGRTEALPAALLVGVASRRRFAHASQSPEVPPPRFVID
eukprot:SAG31_NODE_31337_length_369_cov_0.951852_2_plen_78_part_01